MVLNCYSSYLPIWQVRHFTQQQQHQQQQLCETTKHYTGTAKNEKTLTIYDH